FLSMCSVPMVSSGRLVGVLNVQSERERHFGGPEVAFLAAIAAQVAGAVERSAIQRRLEERLTELRRAEDLLRRLSELALAGAGPEPICAAIAGPAGPPVAPHGEAGARRAGAGGPSGRGCCAPASPPAGRCGTVGRTRGLGGASRVRRGSWLSRRTTPRRPRRSRRARCAGGPYGCCSRSPGATTRARRSSI